VIAGPANAPCGFKYLAITTGLFCLGLTIIGQSFLASNQLNDADSSYFVYGGQLILDGGVLYRDFWDQKPPAIFYQNALLIKLLGLHFGRFAIIHGIALLICCLILYRTFAGLATRGIALGATLVFCFGFNLNNYQDFGNRPEFAMSLLELLGICAALKAITSHSPRYWLYVGIFSFCAFLFKPVGMAGLLAAAVFLSGAWFGTRERTTGQGVRWLLVGAIIPLLPITLWLLHQETLVAFLNATFVTPLKLASVHHRSYPQVLHHLIYSYGPFWGMVLPLAVIPLVCGFHPLTKPQKKVLCLLLLFMLASLCGIIVQKKGYPHYYQQGIAPLVLFSFYILHLLMQKLTTLRYLVLAGFVLSLGYYGRWHALRQWRYYRDLPVYRESFLPYTELGTWLRNHLSGDEMLYYWALGYQPYILSATHSPGLVSPFLLVHGDYGAELVQEDLKRVKLKPVRFMIELAPDANAPLALPGVVNPSPAQRACYTTYQNFRDKQFCKMTPQPCPGFIVYQRK